MPEIFGPAVVHALGGQPQRGNAGDVFGAGAQPLFLPGAVKRRKQAGPLGDVKSAGALGSVYFVAAYAYQLDAPLGRLDGQAAEGLHAVGVEDEVGAFAAAGGGNGGQVMDGAGLAVHHHAGGQDGLFIAGGSHRLRGDMPAFIGRHGNDLKALIFQRLADGKNGMVLHGGGDDAVAPALHGTGGPQQGDIIAFRPPAGKDDLLGAAVQHGGHLPPGLGHGTLRQKAPAVQRGGVAVFFGHYVQRQGGRFGRNGGGGAVIQVTFHGGLLWGDGFRAGRPLRPLIGPLQGAGSGRSPPRLRRGKAGFACFRRLRRRGCAPHSPPAKTLQRKPRPPRRTGQNPAVYSIKLL